MLILAFSWNNTTGLFKPPLTLVGHGGLIREVFFASLNFFSTSFIFSQN
jgi:hypothetical protein